MSTSGGAVIGIDSGVGGAVAILDRQGALVALEDMPAERLQGERRRVHPRQFYELLWPYRREAVVYAECIWGRSTEGVRGLMTLGHTEGVIDTAVSILRLGLVWVRAIDWKAHHGIAVRGREEAKAQACLKAALLYPQAKLTRGAKGRVPCHDRAEALLIARYGYETQNPASATAHPRGDLERAFSCPRVGQ